MINRFEGVQVLVQDQLEEAGFDVRIGFLHGSWHMVADLDDATFAVSGTNLQSVASALLEACSGEFESSGLEGFVR